MPLKTIEIEGTTYAEIKDGKPIYVAADGTETVYDAEGLAAQLHTVNGESASRRKALKELKERVEAFEGIDPDAARKALATMEGLDTSKLIEAGKANEMKEAAVAAVKAEMAKLEGERNDAVNRYEGALVQAAFGGSRFIAEKLAIPADMVQATFGQRFSTDEGVVLGRDAAGNVIYGPDGQPASFDAALEKIVSDYPQKDMILRGGNKGGSNAPGGGAGGGAAGSITGKEFEALSLKDPEGASKFIKDGGTVE